MKDSEKELLEITLDEARRDLVSGLAEILVMELNNPLAIIHGRTYQIRALLAKTPVPRDEALDILTKLDSGLDRLTKLTRGLGLVCKGNAQEDRQTVAVADILTSVLELAGESSRYRGVELNCTFAPEVIMVKAQADSLIRGLLQVVIAAIEAAQHRPNGRVSIHAWREDKESRIQIESSGLLEGGGSVGASQKRRMAVLMTASRALIEGEGGTLKQNPSSGKSSCVVTLPIQEVIS